MKVRIVKAFTDCWYKEQIGSIFNVQEGKGMDDKPCFFVSAPEKSLWYIRMEDCEIIPEENQPEPFDLDRALKGEPIQTKSGKIAKSLGAARSKDYSGIAVEIDSEIRIYGRSGVWDTFNDKEALIMAPRESEYMTIWVNVYYSEVEKMAHLGNFFNSKEEAQKCIVDHLALKLIDTLPITFKRPK